jgi:MFS family permease
MPRLLRRGPFRWMLAGEAASMLGDRFHEIALAWLVLSTLNGSPLSLSLVLLAATVPRAALVLVGGAVTDRLPPRTLLLASNLARAVLSGLLAMLVLTGEVQLWQLSVLAFGFGGADAFFLPAIGTIVPDLVEQPEDLPRANALIGVGEQVTMLAGPAIGGILVAATGSGGAFAINSLSFVAAAAGVLPARGRGRRPGAPADTHLLQDVRAGLGYARSHPGLRVMLLVVSVGALVYTGLFGVGIPALARTFPNGALGLGALLAASGLGQLAGTLSATATGLPRRLGLLVIGSMLVEAAAMVALAILPSLWLDAAAIAVAGFVAAYSQDVAQPTWIQRNTLPAMLGRVNSMIWVPRTTLGPVSLILVGAVTRSGVGIAFIAGGALLLATAVGITISRSGRRLEL